MPRIELLALARTMVKDHEKKLMCHHDSNAKKKASLLIYENGEYAYVDVKKLLTRAG